MKKAFLIKFLILFISITANSQDFLVFKVRYKPQTKYYQIQSYNLKASNTFSGTEDVLKRLKEREVQNPTVTTSFMKSESNILTGKLNSKNVFPIACEYINGQSLKGKVIIPKGTIVYGKGTLDNMPVLDSVASEQLDADFKKSFLKSLNDLISQINFPVKKIKIGESFTQEIPFSFPVANNNLEMIIKTEYKLIAIKNNLGYFEIKSDYTMKTEISEKGFKGKGTGEGTLVYDIQNNFFQKFYVKSEVEMDFSMNDLKLNIKSETESSHEIKISKN
ncbi:hypothetical protein NAT51_08225 [Flavobacterium amniphilum]|uniref:hypothetical protein n=1 Tax=Flavobacterium amniphilum TaxID=1834035 RepID=UPI00202AA2EC|nr:hypothetical protein [Flavobacterium amniphilum]MCL9805505.1 hypothetical protein [Flavobacterium amniphilum]